MSFVKVTPKDIAANPFELIGDEWMLITAGDRENLNMMTASWGGLGVLWGKNVSFCFIRPTRCTYGLMESGEYYTLSFYDEKYRDKLTLCGTKSGRDIDKIAESGLTPVFADCGAPYFEQAKRVLVCRKLYADDIKPESFIDRTMDKWYDNDYHKVYIGEIIEVLEAEDR